MRIPIIYSDYNSLITQALLTGAQRFLQSEGVASETYAVAGAFELPLVAQWLLQSQGAEAPPVDGIVAIGCIIEGETRHFDWICNSTISRLSELMVQHAVPIGLGILTPPHLSSALERAGGKCGNKGQEAAQAVWRSLQVKTQLQGFLSAPGTTQDSHE